MKIKLSQLLKDFEFAKRHRDSASMSRLREIYDLKQFINDVDVPVQKSNKPIQPDRNEIVAKNIDNVSKIPTIETKSKVEEKIEPKTETLTLDVNLDLFKPSI